MQRRELVVGDPPAGGGRILPFVPPFSVKIMDHQVAIIGGRVYCEACGSVGVIAKAGGPRRRGYITEVALEGDVCVCQCPEPQPLVSTLQNTSSCDDTDYGGGPGIPLWMSGAEQHLVASKIVDEQVQHPPEAQATENICPNMTNQAFARLMIELRNEAVKIVALRLQELERWDSVAKDRILEWFGDPGFGQRNAHLNDLRLVSQDWHAVTGTRAARAGSEEFRSMVAHRAQARWMHQSSARSQRRCGAGLQARHQDPHDSDCLCVLRPSELDPNFWYRQLRRR